MVFYNKMSPTSNIRKNINQSRILNPQDNLKLKKRTLEFVDNLGKVSSNIKPVKNQMYKYVDAKTKLEERI
jgi:hypothetical protein